MCYRVHNIFPIISLWELLVAILHVKFDQDLLTDLRDIYVYIFSIISLWENFRRSRACNSKLIVRSGPKSNSSVMVCLSSLLASLKKVQSKLEALLCPKLFFRAQGRVTPKFLLTNVARIRTRPRFYGCPGHL